MVDPSLESRQEHPPVVVRGDAELTRQLIDSLDFKHKYTSGVLSFAPIEVITPDQEQSIKDRFEQVAFAALTIFNAQCGLADPGDDDRARTEHSTPYL